MRTLPEVYSSRAEATQALWKMAADGRADCYHDSRYRALVLLATFASLRWGEVIALRRCDLDLDRCTVRVRAAYVERSTRGNAARAAQVQGGTPCRRNPCRDRSCPA
jgi:integrase